MIKEFPQRLQISIMLLVLGGAVFLGAATSFYNQNQLEDKIKENISEQRDLLNNLLELTNNNSADSVTSSIFKDCSKRKEYDSLLTRLDSLSRSDLIKLQSLSESCGNYYPGIKAIMVSRLEREFIAYTELIDLLKELDTDEISEYKIKEWEEIIEVEKKRSDLLREQSDVQLEIIQLLIQGNSAQSIPVQEQVKNADRINVLLVTQYNRIEEIRTSLNP